MRAPTLRNKQFVIEELPAPIPSEGQILVKTRACGICGTDLHARLYGKKLRESAARTNGFGANFCDGVVLGHEFCAEVVDHGPRTSKRLKPGTLVCSLPRLVEDNRRFGIGWSLKGTGGYGEYMKLTEGFSFPVPNGLSADHAALTEPMAIGYHAVQKARLGKRDIPLVIGCGPVGLAVIASLKLMEARPIVAADFSPRRRKFAESLGADVIVNPAETSPYERWADVAAIDPPDETPNPQTWFQPPTHRPAVAFECVGVPGILNQVISAVPRDTRIVVVGYCMETDHLDPIFALDKELNLQYVMGYHPNEFNATLHHIADGKLPVEELITTKVGLGGIAQAFEDLASPERHGKIIIEPSIS